MLTPEDFNVANGFLAMLDPDAQMGPIESCKLLRDCSEMCCAGTGNASYGD